MALSVCDFKYKNKHNIPPSTNMAKRKNIEWSFQPGCYWYRLKQHGHTIGRILERKPKSTKMDKVRRLSRALNPKHWRHTKTEPQPLPHPSAMGLTSLGTRPRDDTNNEYQDDNIDSASVNSESTKSGSTAMDVSTASDEVEENFYEDVETYPIKSPPVSTNTSSQTGIFSGPAHRSLPPSRMKQNTFIGYSQTQAIDKLDHLSQSSVTEPGMIYLSNHKTIGSAGGNSELHNSVPKPFARAKNWATNFGNNIGNISNRLSTKPREDMPKSNNANFDHRHGRAEAPLIVNSTSIVTHKYIKPPNSKPPLPPQNTDNSVQTSDEKADGRIPPIPQTRQRCGRPSSLNKNTKEDQNGNEESDSSQEHIIFKSITLYDSVSSNKIDKEFPKPKPRGLKKLVPLENDQLILSSPQPKSRRGPARSDDLVRGVEKLSLDSNSSSGSSEALQHDSIKRNGRPKPPPKPRLATHTTV